MVASSAQLRATVILGQSTRGSPMRSVPAVALSIALSALAGSWASEPPAAAPPPTAAAAPARAPSAAAGTTNADNEAAARHAKRTACINQARAKKLVGAQKTAFIKGCIGTP
jgi:hypothetical protein